jgi:hypothetical protein
MAAWAGRWYKGWITLNSGKTQISFGMMAKADSLWDDDKKRKKTKADSLRE